jgi:3-oxoadipate enol-lactonase
MLIRADNRNIYYDLVGAENASVVVLAHSLSADSGIWAEQVEPLLAEAWRILRLDMRGHGGSDPVTGDCTMSDLANDVAMALDFHSFEKVHFVGLSIGGMIGQTFALEHGHRLASLMLCGTAPAALAGGMEKLWAPRFAAIEQAGSVEPLADSTMERWFTDGFKPRRPGRWNQIRETIARTSPQGYRSGGMAIDSFDVVARLPAVKTPTLVVCGDEDPGTPPAGNRLIAERIPGARYQEIANARHIPMVEHPDKFSRIMTNWLASHRRSALRR